MNQIKGKPEEPARENEAICRDTDLGSECNQKASKAVSSLGRPRSDDKIKTSFYSLMERRGELLGKLRLI